MDVIYRQKGEFGALRGNKKILFLPALQDDWVKENCPIPTCNWKAATEICGEYDILPRFSKHFYLVSFRHSKWCIVVPHCPDRSDAYCRHGWPETSMATVRRASHTSKVSRDDLWPVGKGDDTTVPLPETRILTRHLPC